MSARSDVSRATEARDTRKGAYDQKPNQGGGAL